MYHLYSGFLIFLLLSGCANMGSFRSSGDLPDMSPETVSYQQEKQTLFDQPYIDPLTDYLIEHQGDPDRAIILRQIRQERDLRCETVARQYALEAATEAALERYNTGYAYSCPQQIAIFERRVDKRRTEREAEPEPAKEPPPEAVPEPEIALPADLGPSANRTFSDQQLSDCYLLTTIRNFSEAWEACREPAKAGDVRSQANMARVAYAFEDYDSAMIWAEKAAPASADAAFLLGQMHARGQGVSQNADRAVYWYQEAARQGHKEAQATLDRQNTDIPEGNN